MLTVEEADSRASLKGHLKRHCNSIRAVNCHLGTQSLVEVRSKLLGEEPARTVIPLLEVTLAHRSLKVASWAISSIILKDRSEEVQTRASRPRIAW